MNDKKDKTEAPFFTRQCVIRVSYLDISVVVGVAGVDLWCTFSTKAIAYFEKGPLSLTILTGRTLICKKNSSSALLPFLVDFVSLGI